jgi:hypothetical protein
MTDSFDDLVALAKAIDTVVEESERKDARIAELEALVAELRTRIEKLERRALPVVNAVSPYDLSQGRKGFRR